MFYKNLEYLMKLEILLKKYIYIFKAIRNFFKEI